MGLVDLQQKLTELAAQGAGLSETTDVLEVDSDAVHIRASALEDAVLAHRTAILDFATAFDALVEELSTAAPSDPEAGTFALTIVPVPELPTGQVRLVGYGFEAGGPAELGLVVDGAQAELVPLVVGAFAVTGLDVPPGPHTLQLAAYPEPGVFGPVVAFEMPALGGVVVGFDAR